MRFRILHFGRYRDAFLESRHRRALHLTHRSPGRLPSIVSHGSFESEPGRRLLRTFEMARAGRGDLSDEVMAIEGMSGRSYRLFINNLIRESPNPRYLEIGSWAGSTAIAALFRNRARALCIDDWSQFGGPRSTFLANIDSFLSRDIAEKRIELTVIERDFRAVDFGAIGVFNVYLFDGPHGAPDHYDGIRLVQPALTDTYVLIVDDWNWRSVRVGTLQALSELSAIVDSAIEVRTTHDNTHPELVGRESEWHNGYFIAVIRKTPGG